MQKPKFRDAIADMTFKQKKEYIWEYYKLQIIVSLFMLFLVGYTTYEISQRKNDYLTLVVTGGWATTENVRELSDHLSDTLLTKEQQRDYRALVQSIPYSVLDENPAIENVQKLFIRMAAREIDLIIVDEATFADLHDQEYFLSLAELDLDLTGLDTVGDDHETFGIMIDGFEIFSDIFLDEGWVLGVLINSDRLDAVENFLNYMIYKKH